MTVTLAYNADLSRVQITATFATNSNPGFESGTIGWSTTGGTLTQSTEQVHDGTYSGKFVPDGATSNARAESDKITVTPGLSYRAKAWVYCATARDVSVPINWFDSAGVYLSTATATPVTVAAATWTLIEDDFVAPSGAAQGSVVPTLPGVSATTDVLYLDEATIAEPGVGANMARFERSTNGITWSTVRGGTAVPVSVGIAELDDYEFVPGESNTYRVTPLLVEDFEGATDLAVTGTWERTQLTPYAGSWCYSSDPALAGGGTSDAVVTIPAGAETVEFWFRISSEPGFDYFRFFIDATEAGFNSGEVPWSYVPTSTYDITGATTITFRYQKDGSIDGGEDAAYVDNVIFAFAPQTASITPVLNTIWLKSIARPFLNRAVTLTAYSDITRDSRNGVFPIVGRTLPVAVTDVRGSRSMTITLMAPSVDEADELDQVLASGDPILLHVPPGCPIPGMYAVVGEVSVGRRSMRGTRRYLELPLTEVAAPGPDVVGDTVTWQSIVNAFATWGDLIAAEATWHDVAERIGDPGEVIVP